MRSQLNIYLFLALVFATLAHAAAPAQVFLYPPAPRRPGDVSGPPTLSGAQAQAVLQHHLSVVDESVPVPPDHGSDGDGEDKDSGHRIWGHFLGTWDAWEGHARPKVVIVQGADAQHVLGTDAQPAFYIEASDVGVLDEFLAAARAAVERVMRMPLVKGLLDTLDLAVEGASEALASELAALVALADSLWTSAEGAFDAAAVRLDGVTRGSAMWEAATRGVRAGIASMTEEKDGKNAGRVVLVIMPSAGRHYARAVEDNEADKDNDKGKKDGKNSKSAQFSLLAGSTLVLLLAAGAAIAMLYSLGDEPLPPSLRLTPK